MKMNKMIAVLVIAIFVGSGIVGVGSATSYLTPDSGSISGTTGEEGKMYVVLEIPSSYEHDNVIFDATSNCFHVWFRKTGEDYQQLISEVVVDPPCATRTLVTLPVRPGESVTLRACACADYVGYHRSNVGITVELRSPEPKPTQKAIPERILKDETKRMFVIIANHDEDSFKVELYINGGLEGHFFIEGLRTKDCGRFEVPDDLYNEFVASWYDPSTGCFYEERMKDEGTNLIYITLPAHDVKPTPKPTLKPTPKPTPKYKSSDIIIPQIPDVIVEVGETKTIYFEIEYRGTEKLQWNYFAQLYDTHIVKMVDHGKSYKYNPVMYPGRVHGESFSIVGLQEGFSTILLGMEAPGRPVAVYSKFRILVVPKQIAEEEIYPTPCTDLGNQPLRVSEDAGLLEAFGTMIIRGWRALMDFFH